MAVATVLPVAPAAAQGGGRPVLVVGDSLEVGSGPYLRQALAGVVALEIDAERGRTSSEGLRVLGSKLRAEHEVVVFPLGTNDLSADTLAASLAAARELAGGRCVVVATIARPNLRGSPTAELNRVVEQFAGGSGAAGGGAAAGGGVQVMDWRSAALSTPGVLGRDRIHATGRGYGLRASLLAEAVQGCLLGGDLGGIPAPENPDARVPDPLPRDPNRAARRSGRARTQPRPESAAKLPAPELMLALGAMVERVMSVVRPALAGARAAATTALPEPVLGAPEE